MATQVQFRGGTTVEHSSFTGAAKEVTVDTVKKTVVVHDDNKAGGFPLLRAEGGAQDISTTGDISAADGTFTGDATLTGDLTINTNALVVDASAKTVGIGGAPTAGILHTIGSGANQAIRFECTDDNHVRLELDADRSTDSVLTSFDGLWDGTTVTKIQTLAGANDESDADLLFLTKGNTDAAPVERMRIDSSGVVKLTQPGGNPRYGSLETSGDKFILKAFGGHSTQTAAMCFYTGNDSPTEAMRILSGGGLTFNGDTATANALDDYEEGTFTPTLTSGITETSGIYNTTDTKGHYTKIGNIVRVHLRLHLNGTGTANSSQVYIGGLPFTCLDTDTQYVTCTHYVNKSTDSGTIMKPLVYPSGTSIRIFSQESDEIGNIVGTNAGNAFDIILQAVYRV